MKNKRVLSRMQFRIFGLVSLLLGVSLWAASGASAQPEHRGPCADDVAKFCKDAQPGTGGIAKCLKEHEDELSPACKERVQKIQERSHENHKACAEDIAKLCKDVKPGEGAMAKCLKEHENELSPACKDHIQKMNERKHEGHDGRAVCKDDVVKFCKDMKPGGGSIMRCLKEHEAELSPACREQMEKRQAKQGQSH